MTGHPADDGPGWEDVDADNLQRLVSIRGESCAPGALLDHLQCVFSTFKPYGQSLL